VEKPTIEYSIETPYGAILEIGAGTGLAGITAALDYQTTVWCTDLPDIVLNLERNVQANAELLSNRNADVRCGVLDWNDPQRIRASGADTQIEAGQPGAQFQIVLAADILYEPQHAEQIASVVFERLERTPDARFIVALPQRPGSAEDWHDFEQALVDRGITIVEQGEDVGYEDWVIPEDEAPAEVTIWWSTWAWTPSVLSTSRRDKCIPQ
jgi:predicted nicotinamide N-methyase